MHTFVILCSALISTAYAASLGYSYGNNGGSSFGSGLASGASFGGQSVSAPSFSSSGLSFGSGIGGGSVGGFSLGSQGVVGPSYSAPASVGSSYVAPVAPAETVKDFYTFTAPEQEFSDIGDTSQYASSLKKNLRVIFIKGPENNGLENAAIQLANSAAHQQTAIYVLSKQADIADLANKLQSVGSFHSSKPDVHFIKYRTQADAENAQQAIKSQYDSLQGPTSSHSGGVAPVLNFASQPAPAPVAQQSYSAAPVVGNVESTYLPPNKRA